ncbi:uncharacterized protein [Drosophila takahashii]|uniref:uncharacterized protein n=1 Tax=Drosophila takahashii TaxID=29030 RepID=UPI00389930E5
MHIGNAILILVRVGGRLDNSDLPYSAKHPAILPKQHRFTRLYVEFLHRSNLHAGPKVLLSLLRENVWVINGRALVRQVVRECTHCFHYKPRLMSQIMGNLPPDRLVGERAFLVSGVDFCGPFLTSYKIRSKSPYKTYASIFVCFATKATHIELVSELTTNAFLSCIRRFIARRGLPQRIYCDNAKNFVGAANKMKEFQTALLEPESISLLESYSARKGFSFCFIPPRAPHFGGLWEAAVKSAKTLLLKNIAEANFTYEELLTVLAEVKAILNSRPIAPVSDDPNDGAALSPAHFLIGSALLSAPDESLYNPTEEDDDSKLRYLTRWQRVTFINQHFWRRWRRDYIHSLQVRGKWTKPQANIQVGQLVIVHEDNFPPRCWSLARVTGVTYGRDHRVRVVDLHTAKGPLRRAIHKLAPLPFDCN